jgi:hypothetical protein
MSEKKMNKTECVHRCPWGVVSSCSTSDTRRVTHVKYPVIGFEC